MARKRTHPPLRVYQNGRLVGRLLREPSGAIEFQYDGSWIAWPKAFPISLSLPLRDDPWRGAPVAAVFENLLPDSDALRRRVAERVGAEGTDAYSLLAAIGRDCIGALQFLGEDAPPPGDATDLKGEVLDEAAIEKLLLSLAEAPLGLQREDEFRIAVAGAQEKTALLWRNGQWIKPHGTTPTTHLFKTPIGQLSNGMDLSDSVENEYYCLQVLKALGLPTNDVSIQTFGRTKALVITRFDRAWVGDRLIRLPQEDCCQALGVPPTRKYQSEGGPGIIEIAGLLRGADSPEHDLAILLKSQVAFWLLGATDGHAKNFSVHLRPGGRYALTPIYDVLSVQPSLDRRQIERKQMKLAMCIGDGRHYRVDEIHARHFEQTAARAGMPPSLVRQVFEQVAAGFEPALAEVRKQLPGDFPAQLVESIEEGALSRLRRLHLGLNR